jgi:hypothetical protein
MSYLQMPNGSRAPMVHPCHDPRHRVLLGAGEDGQNFEAEMLRTRLALRDRHHGLELASAFGSEAEVHGCRVRLLRSRLTPEQT